MGDARHSAPDRGTPGLSGPVRRHFAKDKLYEEVTGETTALPPLPIGPDVAF